MPTIDEVREAVAEAFDTRSLTVDAVGDKGNRFTIQPGYNWDFTFAELQKLALLLGTNLIDIYSEAGHEDYSDITPGYPGDFWLEVRF